MPPLKIQKRSALEHAPFLLRDFVSVVGKVQWVMLPYLVAWNLPGLRLRPLVVKEERERRTMWLGDNSYFKLNCITLPISELLSTQYGQDLDLLLQETVFAKPKRGLVYMLKADVFGGFYWIRLRPTNAPNLGLIFPVDGGNEPLVATPLTLPMGWKNLPPLLCTTMESVDDLSNQALFAHAPLRTHKLDNRAATVVSAVSPTLDTTLVTLSWEPLLLCTNAQLLAYVDVLIYEFLGLAQGLTHRRFHVRRNLFHALDKVFRTLDKLDPTQRKEVISIKKLDAGDC